MWEPIRGPGGRRRGTSGDRPRTCSRPAALPGVFDSNSSKARRLWSRRHSAHIGAGECGPAVAGFFFGGYGLRTSPRLQFAFDFRQLSRGFRPWLGLSPRRHRFRRCCRARTDERPVKYRITVTISRLEADFREKQVYLTESACRENLAGLDEGSHGTLKKFLVARAKLFNQPPDQAIVGRNEFLMNRARRFEQSPPAIFQQQETVAMGVEICQRNFQF